MGPGTAPLASRVVGQIKLTASAATSAFVPFTEVCESLFGEFWIPSYGGSDIISVQLGASTTTADTGTTYTTNYAQSSTAGTWTAPSTAVTLPTTMLRLGANAVTTSRHGFFSIANANVTVHPFECESTTVTTASVAPTTSVGTGGWVTASASQALGFRLATPGGQTMATGTWCVIYGYNPF